jgi:hypothetical protein
MHQSPAPVPAALSDEQWAERNFLRVHQNPATLQLSVQYLIARHREPGVQAAERERKARLKAGQ